MNAIFKNGAPNVLLYYFIILATVLGHALTIIYLIRRFFRSGMNGIVYSVGNFVDILISFTMVEIFIN